MSDGLDDVRGLLPGARLATLEVLGGGDRSVVRRVRADTGTDTGALIVKTFTGAGDGWVRESAALSVMPPRAPAPRLITSGDRPPIVVMSDAGTGPSVADALIGTDPAAAADAVRTWARTIASLHAATLDVRDSFRAALDARAGDWPVAESTVPTDLDDAARVIAKHCTDLGVDVPAVALDELRGLAGRLGGAGPAALTPGDTCPDNNVRAGDRLVLIDFEAAQWRHIAWDAAYLLVPWPSCWCSWRIPDQVAAEAVEAYRAVLATPYADAAAFHRDLAAAAVGWAFISTSWFLPRALVDDAPAGTPRQPTPTRRAMILHRLAGARRSGELSALADLAARLHDALADRWGEAPLDWAPAFRR